MLLSHTSSLNEEEDAHINETTMMGKDDTERTLASLATSDYVSDGSRRWEGQWTKNKPGSARFYCNDAFVLLAFAVQRITKQGFGQYLDQQVFKPLGMTQTTYELKGHEYDPYAVPYASLRQPGGKYQHVPAKQFWYHQDPGDSVLSHQTSAADYPSGLYHTTAGDLARLMRMFLNSGTLDGVRILSAKSIDSMTRPNGLYNHEGWRQGVGVYGPRDLNGRWFWGHDGVDRGAATAFFFDPKAKIGAIALANAQYPDWTLTAALVDIDLHLIAWFE